MERKKGMKLNGFSLFMKEKRPAMEAEGSTFAGGWKDVATALDKAWGQTSKEEQEDYRRRAKEINDGTATFHSSTSKKAVRNGEDEGEDSDDTFGAGSDGTKLSSRSDSLLSVTSSGDMRDDTRRTSHGIYFRDILEQKRLAQLRQQGHLFDLQELLIKSDPKQVPFTLINFSMFCTLYQKMYIPAEVAMTAFDVQNGILGNMSFIIDPYVIPTGFGIETREHCEVIGLPYPPFDNRFQNYHRITDAIQGFANRFVHTKNQKPKVYCLTDEMTKIRGCLEWLFKQVGQANPIELYPFGEAMRILTNIGVANRQLEELKSGDEIMETLIKGRVARDLRSNAGGSSIGGIGDSTTQQPNTSQYTTTGRRHTSMSSVVTSSSYSQRPFGWTEEQWAVIRAGIFTHEKQVDDLLQSFNLAFDKELACIYHCNYDSETDTPVRLCPLNVTNRYAYNMLDILINVYKIGPVLNYHIPSTQDDPEREKDRRAKLQKRWGIVVKSTEDFFFNPNIKPKHFVPTEPLGQVPADRYK